MVGCGGPAAFSRGEVPSGLARPPLPSRMAGSGGVRVGGGALVARRVFDSMPPAMLARDERAHPGELARQERIDALCMAGTVVGIVLSMAAALGMAAAWALRP